MGYCSLSRFKCSRNSGFQFTLRGEFVNRIVAPMLRIDCREPFPKCERPRMSTEHRLPKSRKIVQFGSDSTARVDRSRIVRMIAINRTELNRFSAANAIIIHFKIAIIVTYLGRRGFRPSWCRRGTPRRCRCSIRVGSLGRRRSRCTEVLPTRAGT